MNTTCLKCRAPLPADSIFCPKCGWNQKKAPIKGVSRSQAGVILGLGVAIWTFGYFTSVNLAGKKPTEHYVAQDSSAGTTSVPNVNDDEIKAARAEAEKNPQALEPWKSLGSLLIIKLQHDKPNAQTIMLELIDVLGKILSIDPNDQEALLVMGDISFDQNVYDKSANYYDKYLAKNPADLAVRARLGSSLALSGDSVRAKAELKQVLAKDPKHFAALSYLTIALAQSGEKQEALSTAQKALEVAPEGEAKTMISGLIERIKSGEFPTTEGKVHGTTPPAATKTVAGAGDAAGSLKEFLSSNPVAGPKFVSVETARGGELRAVMHDFPMNAMPPFAKTKFFSGVKGAVAGKGVKVVKFIDQKSGAELESVQIDG